MNSFHDELAARLDRLKQQALHRQLHRVDSAQGPCIQREGKQLLNFASNDYLGLANEPSVKSAAVEAIQRYGAGAGASRLLCGSLAPFHLLEQILAQFKGADAALTFSTGYATALGAICALMEKHDVIILDRLVHACIVDAARLSSATLRVFGHNDVADLESILKWSAGRHLSAGNTRKPAVLIVTESVFSMDGDFAPLRDLVALKERYGAWLMLDEAHATGLYGRHGRGLADHFGVADRVEVQMGTLGKALGSSGGYICGSRTLIDYLINRARPFIFSTAPVPAAAAAATAAIVFVQSPDGESRRSHLRSLSARLTACLSPRLGYNLGVLADGAANHIGPSASEAPGSSEHEFYPAIFPVLIGDESRALSRASDLLAQDLYVPAIRYPTVPRGKARLRISLSAAHSHRDLERLTAALHPERCSHASHASSG